MTNNLSETLEKYQDVIPKMVIDNYIGEIESARGWFEWKTLVEDYINLKDAYFSKVSSSDHRFSTFLWAYDVRSLCNQIGYSYCWMRAYADYYRASVSEGDLPSHTDFHVSYYLDNCIVRIDSTRDKMALMVWSYYCVFDPEKRLLVYEDIVERLTNQAKFGLALKRGEDFLQYLEQIENGSFKLIEGYRNSKIHRREPRYEMYDVKSHHGWPYLSPQSKQGEDGIRFEPNKSYGHLGDYEELEEAIRNSLLKILVSASGCFRNLLQREPFQKEPRL